MKVIKVISWYSNVCYGGQIFLTLLAKSAFQFRGYTYTKKVIRRIFPGDLGREKKNRKGMMFGLPLKLLTTFQNKASAVGKITWLCCSTWLCFNILFKQIFNLEHLKKLFSLNSRIKNSRGMTFTLPTSAQPLIQALFSLQQCIKKTLLSCLFTEN